MPVNTPIQNKKSPLLLILLISVIVLVAIIVFRSSQTSIPEKQLNFLKSITYPSFLTIDHKINENCFLETCNPGGAVTFIRYDDTKFKAVSDISDDLEKQGFRRSVGGCFNEAADASTCRDYDVPSAISYCKKIQLSDNYYSKGIVYVRCSSYDIE